MGVAVLNYNFLLAKNDNPGMLLFFIVTKSEKKKKKKKKCGHLFSLFISYFFYVTWLQRNICSYNWRVVSS